MSQLATLLSYIGCGSCTSVKRACRSWFASRCWVFKMILISG